MADDLWMLGAIAIFAASAVSFGIQDARNGDIHFAAIMGIVALILLVVLARKVRRPT